MVYKPNFCCNCGEKITRGEWKVLTSRRFCDVCAVEQKGHELFIRALIAGSLLVGIFGFGSYLRTPQQPTFVLTGGTPDSLSAVPLTTLKAQPAAKGDAGEMRSAGQTGAGVLPAPPQPGPPGASKEQLRGDGFASDNAVFYCGAMTKKGRPCARRVKTKGRCWQHAGHPDAAPSSPASGDVY